MMNTQDNIIDSALETYPMAALPRGFVRRTMQQVNPKPRFQIGFLDLALPVFFILFALTVLAIGLLMVWLLNPVLTFQIQSYIQLMLLYASNATPSFVAFTLIGTMLALVTGSAGLLLWIDEMHRAAIFSEKRTI